MSVMFLLQQNDTPWAGIPHDPASLFIYFLLLASGIAIWRGSRKKGD